MTTPNIGHNVGTVATLPTRPGPLGGRLQSGGTKGKAGRKPAAIRAAALKMLQRNLPVLDQIAKGVTVEFIEDGKTVLATPRPGERIAALRLLGDLGMGEKVAVSDVRSRIRAMLALVHERETWTRDELLAALASVWT